MPIKTKANEHLHSKTGSIDRYALSHLDMDQIIVCSKNHKNGPTARFCWRCGELLQRQVESKKEAGYVAGHAAGVRSVPYESADPRSAGSSTDGPREE